MISRLKSIPALTYGLIALSLILAIVSFAAVAPIMESPETYPSTIQSLDNKRLSVVEMSTALVGLSVVVAAVPGDATTPVANQISELNSYLIIVLGAIMLEKFLLPIIAMIVWRALIPIALVAFALFLLFRKRLLRIIAIYLLILSVAMICLIPFGVKIGDMVDNSFGTEDLLKKVSSDMKDMTKDITKTIEDNTPLASFSEDSDTKAKKKDQNKDKSILEQISGFKDSLSDIGNDINDLKDNLSDGFASLGDTFSAAAELAIEKAKVIMGDLMDAVAILLVTVCAIPIGTLLLMFGIVKLIFELLLRQISEPLAGPPSVL